MDLPNEGLPTADDYGSPSAPSTPDQAEKPAEISDVDSCPAQSGLEQSEKLVPVSKISDVAILFGPWTAQQCREIVVESFDACKTVHNCFTCHQTECTNISKDEEQRIQPKKFQHSWLKKDHWWLCYVEGESMYCLICRKNQMRHPQNQNEVFASTPSVRLKLNAISTHSSSNLHS